MSQLCCILHANRKGREYIQTWEMESELLVEPDSEDGDTTTRRRENQHEMHLSREDGYDTDVDQVPGSLLALSAAEGKLSMAPADRTR